MKGSGIILLLYCIASLYAVLTSAQTLAQNGQSESPDNNPKLYTPKVPAQEDNSTAISTVLVSEPASTTTSEASTLSTADSSTTKSASPINHGTPFLPTPVITADCTYDRKTCVTSLIVVGVLIIVCTFLVVSNVVLTWKVCQLNRRILTLTTDADLISNSEYWMGTAKKNKSNSEPEAKESVVLLGDLTQTQEEVGESEAKEEGANANKDGQIGEETVENGKEAGESAKNETSANGTKTEKPESASKNALSPTTPVATTDSPSTTTTTALTSESSE